MSYNQLQQFPYKIYTSCSVIMNKNKIIIMFEVTSRTKGNWVKYLRPLTIHFLDCECWAGILVAIWWCLCSISVPEDEIFVLMWTNLLDSDSLTMARFKASPSMRSNENQAHYVQDKAVLQAESSNQFKWTQTRNLVKLSDICNHATFPWL